MTILLIISALVQLIYWYYYFKALSDHISPTRPSDRQPTEAVSVVICAKNAGHLLQRNLPTVLDQAYPQYTVHIADDHSTDDTLEILKKIDNEKGNLFVHEVKQNNRGKRQALWEGIVKSRHQWVILTDSDCHPQSSQWIATMMGARTAPEHKLILGYSPYRAHNSLVSWWSHFEAWMTALLYLSFALKGRPYMGVGRNMCYDKRLLNKAYLDRYQHLASGDDDLTVMQMATPENTNICIDPASYVYTEAEPTWWRYIQQKRRHYSTAISYKPSTILLLSGHSLSQIGFYVLFLGSLFSGLALAGWTAYILRMLWLAPIVNKLCRRLETQFHPLLFPIFDLALAVYYVVFSFSVLFPKKKEW
jgi:glycosyltransferase involved in cell wall biosynthesis